MKKLDWNELWSQMEVEGCEARKGIWDHVMAPLTDVLGKTVRGNKAQKVLRECFVRGEEQFLNISSRHSLEFWLPAVRDLRGRIHPIDNYEIYLTLGLVKYSNPIGDVCSMGKIDSSFDVKLDYTNEDLLDAQRIAYLAFLLAGIGNVYRRIGKGSILKPTTDLPLRDEAPEPVNAAIKSYDVRRPSTELFRDMGIMHNVPSEISELYFMAVAPARPHVQFVVPEWNQSWPCVRLPAPFNAGPIIRVLEDYRDAVEDIYGNPLASLLHFLTGLSALTSASIPILEELDDDKIRLKAKTGDDEGAWRNSVDFLTGFSRKGYFRFPEEHWIKTFAKVRSPWADTEDESIKRIKQCLSGFGLTSASREGINLSALRPVPFCFKAASDLVYVDVQAIPDFLRGLIEASKEWFATQGGDRFTLALKRRVEIERPEVEIVGWKQDVPVEGGHPIECDLLLATGSTLFVIECKAFAKSLEFYRGDLDAVNFRTLKLKDAMKQAQKQALAVNEVIRNGGASIPKRGRVEAIVCMPTQEFICPIDAFGFVVENIPRICTPEELFRALVLLS